MSAWGGVEPMNKRVWIGGCLILVAVVVVYTARAVRRGYQASWDSSRSVSVFEASCQYLVYAIEHDLEWPQSSEEFHIGLRSLIEAGEIVDQADDLPKYVRFVAYDGSNSAELTVCSERFPVQSDWLSCDEQAMYGGSRLLLAIQEHPGYFGK